MRLYSVFPATIQTEFDNFSQWAKLQEKIHIGSPGGIEERSIGSNTYFYHRYYDANGKLVEKYIGGPSGVMEAQQAYENAKDNIDRANMVVRDVKMFRKLGFSILDDKAGATLAALHNHGLFSAGLTLIGSHAYGAILNNLGVKAPRYLTDDIDTVRTTPLRIATTPQLSLLDVLKTSGLPFIKVKTGIKPADKSETYKLPGNVKLLFDLLVNGSEVGTSVLIPELAAYAQSVPYLTYLVENRLPAVILSKNYAVPIYTPNPARFAAHKLFSAASRINQPAKSDKDILQAATVICAMEDKYPGDITEALNAFPTLGKSVMLEGAESALPIVQSYSEEYGEMLRRLINDIR